MKNDAVATPSVMRRWRLPPVAVAILGGVLVGGAILVLTGADPFATYRAMIAGALWPANLPDTLNWAVPVIGMTLVAALPLRAGLLNLGGDGQMIIGAMVAALVPLYCPGPAVVVVPLTMLLAMTASGLYAMLAAWGEISRGIPMLISSLLLGYPAAGLTSYLVTFPLRDTSTGLAQTRMIPPGMRLPVLAGPLNIGVLLIALVAVIAIYVDRQTVAGYEVRMRGLNARFAAYGGIDLDRQAYRIMFASGAIAGLVGTIIVLGSYFRFINYALLAQGYGPTGFMAALLSGGELVGAVIAGLFFAALQIGGVAMQRETEVPRVLTMVLQAMIILFLALRTGLRKTAP
ncbi:MAG: ABC transporter permease [Rhizobium sp.]